MDVLTAERLAEVLQEPNILLLTQVLRVLGTERCLDLLADTLTLEANGGMLTHTGARRRTPGGVFLQLVRERTTPKERWRLFPGPAQHQSPSRPQAPSWEEIQTLSETLKAEPPGEAKGMKATLVGRPGKVETRQTCVVFQMQGRPPGPLPKGLPPIPNTPPLTWTVIVALRQWNRVKDSLTSNADDQLIIEGYPMLQGTQPVLMAQSCVSMQQQRAQKQAQQAAMAQQATD
jgi:PHAX RNA-binding domain-containing protein